MGKYADITKMTVDERLQQIADANVRIRYRDFKKEKCS